MRILVISNAQLPLPPIRGGSVENVIHNVFIRLAETNSVTIICPSDSALPKRETRLQGKLRYIRISERKPLSFVKAALKQAHGQSFDVIQVENRPAFIPYVRKTFPRTPIMLSLHSLSFMSKLTKSEGRKVLSQADGVSTVSRFVTRSLQKEYPAFKNKFFTTHNGVDTDRFKPMNEQSRRNLMKKYKIQGRPKLLFVGRIVPRKGLHILIKSAILLKPKYSGVKIVAVGSSWPGVKKETAYMRKARLLSKKHEIPLIFTGYISPTKVHELYQLGDVFVCPTLYPEGFGLVNLEAMASGIPIVSSNRGGISEVVKNGSSGILVSDYKNPKAYAGAINKILISENYKKKLCVAGRKRAVSQFSWSRSALTLGKHYRSLLSR